MEYCAFVHEILLIRSFVRSPANDANTFICSFIDQPVLTCTFAVDSRWCFKSFKPDEGFQVMASGCVATYSLHELTSSAIWLPLVGRGQALRLQVVDILLRRSLDWTAPKPLVEALQAQRGWYTTLTPSGWLRVSASISASDLCLAWIFPALFPLPSPQCVCW